MRTVARVLQIVRICLRYRLDEPLPYVLPVFLLRCLHWFVPRAPETKDARFAHRLKKALEELGPIFVKFGQILSTRRDLLSAELAEQLASLQDEVKPFPGAQAVALVEESLAMPVSQAFATFDREPLASASMAQVHAATLPDGRAVAVKVLRPAIRKLVDRDLRWLRKLAAVLEKTLPNAQAIRPKALVDEIAATLLDELDLQKEGANASVLRRNWSDGRELYVPEVYWSHTRENLLTLERVRGIRADDLLALDRAGIDRKKLAALIVRIFYTQVFRDNLFHADAHPGNLWVDGGQGGDARFIALDFGIVGALTPQDQYYLAANFQAMFAQNYARIAELHLEAGWIPAHIRMDQLESAVRGVCEPYFTRPLSEVSLGQVLLSLFKVARRFQLNIQPQLLLLQKTLLNVEGLGRLLDPTLDIWKEAHPVLDEIVRKKYTFRALFELWRKQLPLFMRHGPELPALLHRALDKAAASEQEVSIRSAELKAIAVQLRRSQRASWLMAIALLVFGIFYWLK